MKQFKNNKGFTLLESALAIGVLAMALIGGISVISSVAANTVNQEMNIVASQKASEKIEIILADNEYRGYDYITETNYPEEEFEDTYTLTRSVSIVEVSSSDLVTPQPGSGIKKVEVQVAWGGESSQQFSLSTIVADYE